MNLLVLVKNYVSKVTLKLFTMGKHRIVYNGQTLNCLQWANIELFTMGKHRIVYNGQA